MITNYAGSQAPALTNERLQQYRDQIAQVDDEELRRELQSLAELAEAALNPGDRDVLPVGLPLPVRQNLGRMFDQIDPAQQPGLRNLAFHLLWFAGDLSRRGSTAAPSGDQR